MCIECYNIFGLLVGKAPFTQKFTTRDIIMIGVKFGQCFTEDINITLTNYNTFRI